MVAGNRLNAQNAFLLLVLHGLGSSYRATLSQTPLWAIGQVSFGSLWARDDLGAPQEK